MQDEISSILVRSCIGKVIVSLPSETPLQEGCTIRMCGKTHPFNDSSDQDMFTAAVDFVVTF